MIFGLFRDSKAAGEAIAELKNMDYTDDISVLAKDKDDMDAETHQIKQDITDGVTAGAAVGGVTGVLAGVIAALSTIAIPGVGVFVIGGPLLALWGITGGAIGALTGGLVGALVDLGIPEERAKLYEDRIRQGEVLVSVRADEDAAEKVQQTMIEHGAHESIIVPTKD